MSARKPVQVVDITAVSSRGVARCSISLDGKLQTTAHGATLDQAVREAVRQFRLARSDRKRG